jgi:hypothetical protein
MRYACVFVLASFALISPLWARNNRLLVQSPVISVADEQILLLRCDSGRHIYACTVMEASLTSCYCQAAEDDAWHVSSEASILPRVFTTSNVYLRHEFAHIADVTTQLQEFLTAVNVQTFASWPDCQRTAATVRRDFPKRVREFQMISASRIDHFR